MLTSGLMVESADLTDCVDIVAESDKEFRQECMNADSDELVFDKIFKSDCDDDAFDEHITDGFYDCCDSPNLLDEEIDSDVEAESDLSDEDGELIDMLIGI